ncbi:helix-turn-helix domain-containing protein [Gammaproteobacteria bacterium]|nr:helix-turn-helix domain-containing protein [Gammaproteobacteria bacterium]
MTQLKYGAKLALKEHMYAGNPICQLESMLIYGIQDLGKEISDLRREGEIVRSQKIPLPGAIRRVNQFAVYVPPEALPVKDISVTEYWISK